MFKKIKLTKVEQEMRMVDPDYVICNKKEWENKLKLLSKLSKNNKTIWNTK